MKKLTRFINRAFPNVADRIWVDLFCGVALVRFAQGLPIDATTLGVVFGAYVLHKATKETTTKDEGNHAE